MPNAALVYWRGTEEATATKGRITNSKVARNRRPASEALRSVDDCGRRKRSETRSTCRGPITKDPWLEKALPAT